MDVSRVQRHMGFTNGDTIQRWGRLATALTEQAQIHACGAARIGLEPTGV
jgi:hypothetical protein